MEQNIELDHTLANCPERLHPPPVRVWTPSDGWNEWDVKPRALRTKLGCHGVPEWVDQIIQRPQSLKKIEGTL
jgi:hypothetical protein